MAYCPICGNWHVDSTNINNPIVLDRYWRTINETLYLCDRIEHGRVWFFSKGILVYKMNFALSMRDL